MRQVVQNVRSGATGLSEVPQPVALPGTVLIANVASLISAGTERSVVKLARKSLLGKALERPDHVRRVLEKVRESGLVETLRQVRERLDEPMALGYSSAGIVLACGRGVAELKPGDRVASAGPHAEVVCVGRNLCARIPEGVSFEAAAYAAVAAIALQGVRLARVTLGERVLVIGLGLVGQLTVELLRAQGCRVLATDLDPGRVERARAAGAEAAVTAASLEAILAFSGGAGVDAALLTVATASNQPIELAAEACRARGRIVLVGVAGLDIPRPPFFRKELEFTVSSSLGPGRGEPAYEEKGVDWPVGHVRWTAGRNLAAVLDLMSSGRLDPTRLTTHRFALDEASRAYDLITTASEPHIGVVLEYAPPPPASSAVAAAAGRRRVDMPARAAKPGGPGALGVSLIGAGNFARVVLLPLLARGPAIELRGICSAGGMTAEHAARRHGFAFATTDPDELWRDERTQAVIIVTRHDLHAELVRQALASGRHVMVEKPLCLTLDELLEIDGQLADLGAGAPILAAGFNRRFAPALATLRAHFAGIAPLSLSYRFAVPTLPADHWTHDEEVGGGRVVGEACHAIDACVAIAGSPPARVFAESTATTAGSDDRVVITVRHVNGSLSAVSYQAGGDRAAPAERIEVFGGGRTAVLEGWSELQLWSGGRVRRSKAGRDRGHAAQYGAFIEACRSGADWPVSWPELRAVSASAILALQSLREGTPLDVSSPWAAPPRTSP